jgi:hypothetical protein
MAFFQLQMQIPDLGFWMWIIRAQLLDFEVYRFYGAQCSRCWIVQKCAVCFVLSSAHEAAC